jgi:hypothetical protein
MTIAEAWQTVLNWDIGTVGVVVAVIGGGLFLLALIEEFS